MKIEKNIPMPEAREKWVEIANQMEVGDSVLVKNPTEAVSLRLAIQRKKKGKVVTAKQDCGNIRVWRKE
jgi:hypothetical protein